MDQATVERTREAIIKLEKESHAVRYVSDSPFPSNTRQTRLWQHNPEGIGIDRHSEAKTFCPRASSLYFLRLMVSSHPRGWGLTNQIGRTWGAPREDVGSDQPGKQFRRLGDQRKRLQSREPDTRQGLCAWLSQVQEIAPPWPRTCACHSHSVVESWALPTVTLRLSVCPSSSL